MEMKNVLDQLRAIAETNDSEDVARAIQTADKYSFKDQLAEMEKTNESPSDDDTYCALCGNTGFRLDKKGVPCPNCSEGEGEQKDKDAREYTGESYDDYADHNDNKDEFEPSVNMCTNCNGEGFLTKAMAGPDAGPCKVCNGEGAIHEGDEQIAELSRHAGIGEDMGGMSFNTPMDRHQWLMQQLSQAAGQMDPASAQLVKSIIQKAGNADVKGGNC